MSLQDVLNPRETEEEFTAHMTAKIEAERRTEEERLAAEWAVYEANQKRQEALALGYPPALANACNETGHYACRLQSGDVLSFSNAVAGGRD